MSIFPVFVCKLECEQYCISVRVVQSSYVQCTMHEGNAIAEPSSIVLSDLLNVLTYHYALTQMPRNELCEHHVIASYVYANGSVY